MDHFEVSEFLGQAYLQVGENTQLVAIDLTFWNFGRIKICIPKV